MTRKYNVCLWSRRYDLQGRQVERFIIQYLNNIAMVISLSYRPSRWFNDFYLMTQVCHIIRFESKGQKKEEVMRTLLYKFNYTGKILEEIWLRWYFSIVKNNIVSLSDNNSFLFDPY